MIYTANIRLCTFQYSKIIIWELHAELFGRKLFRQYAPLTLRCYVKSIL